MLTLLALGAVQTYGQADKLPMSRTAGAVTVSLPANKTTLVGLSNVKIVASGTVSAVAGAGLTLVSSPGALPDVLATPHAIKIVSRVNPVGTNAYGMSSRISSQAGQQVSAVFAASASADLLITEVNSNGAGGDFFELLNVGTVPVNLNGWKWVDTDGANFNAGTAVTFGDVTIAPGEVLVVIQNTSDNVATFRAAWAVDPSIQIVGVGGPGLGQNDGVLVFDSAGKLRASFSYRTASVNVTQGDGSVVAVAPYTTTAEAPSAGGHAGISAGGAATVSVVWDPASGVSAPRYTAATAGDIGAYQQAGNPATIGSPGVTGAGAFVPAAAVLPNVGDEFVIYSLTTLGDIFGDTNQVGLTGAATPATADKIYLTENGELVAYFYNTSANAWRLVSAPDGANQESKVIAPGSGVMVVRVGGVDRTLRMQGHTLPSRHAATVATGHNIVNNPFLVATSLSVSDIQSNITGGTGPGVADIVYLENDGVLTGYYFKTGGPGGTGWRALGDSVTDAGAALIQPAKAILFKEQAGALGFALPEPFAD